MQAGCEDAAIVLVCDKRQASLFAGLRDLLWFLLDIAFTNTGWPQRGQQGTGVNQLSPAWSGHAEKHRKHCKAAGAGTSEGQPGGGTSTLAGRLDYTLNQLL